MTLRRVPSFSSRPGFPSGLRVLLVESSSATRKSAEQLLKQCSYQVTSCARCADAVQTLNSGDYPPDVVLADAGAILSKSEDSCKLLGLIDALPLVLMAQQPSPKDVMLGINSGAAEFLETPLSSLKLRNLWQHTVRRAMVGDTRPNGWNQDQGMAFDCKRSASCPSMEQRCQGMANDLGQHGFDQAMPRAAGGEHGHINALALCAGLQHSSSTSQLAVSDCSDKSSELSWETVFDMASQAVHPTAQAQAQTQAQQQPHQQPAQQQTTQAARDTTPGAAGIDNKPAPSKAQQRKTSRKGGPSKQRPLAIKPTTLTKTTSAPALNISGLSPLGVASSTASALMPVTKNSGQQPQAQAQLQEQEQEQEQSQQERPPQQQPPPAQASKSVSGPLGPLAPGMVWGMPMNPLAQAPGITPPLQLPSPHGTVPPPPPPALPWAMMTPPPPSTFPGPMCSMVSGLPMPSLPFGPCPPLGMGPLGMTPLGMPPPPMGMLPSMAATCNLPPVHGGDSGMQLPQQSQQQEQNLTATEPMVIDDKPGDNTPSQAHLMAGSDYIAGGNGNQPLPPLPLPLIAPDVGDMVAEKLVTENVMELDNVVASPKADRRLCDDVVMDKMLEDTAESFLSASTHLSSSDEAFCNDIGGLMHSDSYNVLPSLDMLMQEDNCSSSAAACDNPLGLHLKKSDSLLNMISASLLMSPS